MTEPVPQTPPAETTHEPVSPDAELARKNMLWAWALLGVFVLLFGGTVGIALVYLALD